MKLQLATNLGSFSYYTSCLINLHTDSCIGKIDLQSYPHPLPPAATIINATATTRPFDSDTEELAGCVDYSSSASVVWNGNRQLVGVQASHLFVCANPLPSNAN